MIDFSNKYTCRSCETKTVSRRCDLVRHIKKCDSSINTYFEYYIKYHLGGKLQLCKRCNVNTQAIMITLIHDCCKPCAKLIEIEKSKQTRASNLINDPDYVNKSNLKRKHTNIDKYGSEYASSSGIVRDKVKSTNLERYGSETTLQLEHVTNSRNAAFTNNMDSINKKRRIAWTPNKKKTANTIRMKTVNDKYGVDYITQLPEIQQRISNKAIHRYMDAFTLYYNECKKVTNKFRDTLFDNWDGYCYYTNEALLIDKMEYNNRMYRTIDHKTSI